MSKNILSKTAVNFHFTRVCNYECKFCFHTKKSSYLMPLDQQLKILRLLKESGTEKINFAGGEPFLFPEILGELVKGAKEMGYESTSIISNGSKITKEWLEKYGKWLDILGLSCDTINPETNFIHGRKLAGSCKVTDDTNIIRRVTSYSKDLKILFKLNTVVTSLNKNEDMSNFINEINPMRWKVFQVLDVEGENYNNNTKSSKLNERDVKSFLITQEEFDNYIKRNRDGLINKDIIVPESNDLMRSSYILIDEYGRFLDSSKGGKTPTKSILEVGLENALEELLSSEGKGFHKETFYQRGGYYPDKWSKF
jgi:radical S-adenosyl methionine domain-containing protein 2